MKNTFRPHRECSVFKAISTFATGPNRGFPSSCGGTVTRGIRAAARASISPWACLMTTFSFRLRPSHAVENSGTSTPWARHCAIQ
jgi:hypothetical protein